MNRLAVSLSVLFGALVTQPICAHHSTAVFDRDKLVELRGVVVDFKLRSPHSSLIVDARVFMDGQPRGNAVQRWEIESEALPPMRTMGIDADTFKPGDAITIVATPHRDASFKFAHAQVMTAENGKSFGITSSNRVFSPSLRQALPPADESELPAPQDAAVAPDVVGLERLEGRWQQPLILPSKQGSALALNEAGMAAWRAYDRKASPANSCEPMTVPDVFLAPFYLFDVRVDERQVVVHNEAYDIERTVARNGKPAAADPRGWFGTVRGHDEGDAFVVDSNGLKPSKWGLGADVQPMGNGADVPSSEQKTVRERYSVSPDGRTLILEYTMNDPVYMSEPYTQRVELTRVPDSTQMYPYECDVESASMWSRTKGDTPLRIGDGGAGPR
jgi:hypothetical protein